MRKKCLEFFWASQETDDLCKQCRKWVLGTIRTKRKQRKKMTAMGFRSFLLPRNYPKTKPESPRKVLLRLSKRIKRGGGNSDSFARRINFNGLCLEKSSLGSMIVTQGNNRSQPRFSGDKIQRRVSIMQLRTFCFVLLPPLLSSGEKKKYTRHAHFYTKRFFFYLLQRSSFNPECPMMHRDASGLSDLYKKHLMSVQATLSESSLVFGTDPAWVDSESTWTCPSRLKLSRLSRLKPSRLEKTESVPITSPHLWRVATRRY